MSGHNDYLIPTIISDFGQNTVSNKYEIVNNFLQEKI
jgi:hypothetical protein